MRSKKMILFDCGQTLVDFHPTMADVVRRWLDPHGVAFSSAQLAQVEPLMWRHSARLQQERGLATSVSETRGFWHSVYVGIAADLGLADPVRQADRLTEAFSSPDAWRPFADVPTGLDRLERLGVRLAVVSNWSDALHGILQGLHLADYFEFVITSAEVGVEKPDPAIFRPALDATGLSPAEILYVGDSLGHDLPASAAAGLDFALIDRAGRHVHAPCRRIHSLLDLAALLEKAS